MSAEQTDGLAALGNLTQEADKANPDPAQQAAADQAQAQTDAAEQGAKDWGMLMFMAGGLACLIAPELKPVYSQERCLNWGLHAHQVAAKYGMNSPANMPELALIASTAGFAVPTFFLVREKLKEMKEGKAQGLWAKVGTWWRSRQAKGAAKDATVSEPATDGSK